MLRQDAADGSDGLYVRHLPPGGRFGEQTDELSFSVDDGPSAGPIVAVEVHHEQTIGVGLHHSAPGDAQRHHVLVADQPQRLLHLREEETEEGGREEVKRGWEGRVGSGQSPLERHERSRRRSWASASSLP
jgi:hypothetical protein